jgi:hypothetical protein
VTVNAASINSLNVNWSAPAKTSVAGYVLNYSTSSTLMADGTFVGGTSTNLSSNVTSYLIANLGANTRYYVHVATVTGSGTSAFSRAVSAFTGSIPGEQAAPWVSTLFLGGALIAWNPLTNVGGSPAAAIVVQSSTKATFAAGTVTTDVVAPTETRYALFGLNTGTKYYFRIAVQNGAGTGPWSSAGTLTSQGLPGAPMSPVINAQGTHSAPSATASLFSALTNTGGSAIDFYRVDWSTASNFAAGKTVSTYMDISNLHSQTFKLKADTIYYVRVVAHNRLGYGTASPYATFKSVK